MADKKKKLERIIKTVEVQNKGLEDRKAIDIKINNNIQEIKH